MDRPIVLLAVVDQAVAYADALRRAGFEPTTDLQAAAEQRAAGERLDLAVVDTELPPEALRTAAEAVRGRRGVPCLILLDPASPDAIPEELTGDAAANDDYALKPMPAESLVFRMQALLIRAGRELPGDASADGSAAQPLMGEGHVVSIFAPKGGVGKTTVAVNVAVALRQQTRQPVLLFDADVGVGNVTSVLDVPVRMGLADLADSPPSEWTDAAFEHTVTTHAETGVRVLTWGDDPAESERVTVDLLLAACRWGRLNHSYVVIDNHPGYADRTMAMLTVSSEIFLVITPEMGALRNSSQFLGLARELGLDSMIRVVVNRANHGIRLADMSKTLGLPISASIVSNGPKAVIAANEGKPLLLKYPRERISDDLHRVARLITHPEGDPRQAPVRRRRWMPFARTSSA